MSTSIEQAVYAQRRRQKQTHSPKTLKATMKTVSQLRDDRQAAGLAYEDACLRYTAAWIELHALDLTLNNGNVKRRHKLPTVAVFGSDRPVHLSRHIDFIDDMGFAMPHTLAAAAHKRHENLIAELAD